MIREYDSELIDILEGRINLLLNEVNWCQDILQKITDHCKNPTMTNEEKLHAVLWFTKQGLKSIRED
jgi:hypothetical protein